MSKKIKLCNVLDVQNGYAFDSKFFNDKEGVQLIRIRDLKNGIKTEVKYSADFDEKFLVYKGDYLIGMDGDFICYEWKGEPSLLNQRVCRLVNFTTDIEPKYIYYGINKSLKKIHDSTSFVTVKHISSKQIKEIVFPMIPLEQQKQIAKTLDKANELIELRKESITKLDALAKSIFIDMFGDPVSNPKGWETKGIESLVRKEKYSIKRGPFGGSLKKEIFVKEGYLVYEQYHALNNDFTFARYFIDEKKYQELKAFEIQAGDIIISCSGVYLGKLAVIPNNFKRGIINQALLKISLDENIMKNVMFINIFTNPNFKKKFFGNNIGSGVPNFPSMQDFKKFEFILPPIELQNKFAKIIEKIEEQKSLYEKELEKLEENFQALLQKSFQE